MSRLQGRPYLGYRPHPETVHVEFRYKYYPTATEWWQYPEYPNYTNLPRALILQVPKVELGTALRQHPTQTSECPASSPEQILNQEAPPPKPSPKRAQGLESLKNVSSLSLIPEA